MARGSQRDNPMIEMQAADLRFPVGEGWDSNPRHPGPQLSAQTDEVPRQRRCRTSEGFGQLRGALAEASLAQPA